MKFPLWLGSTVMALGILLPTPAKSEIIVPVSSNRVRVSFPHRNHHYQRSHHAPRRHSRHRVHRSRNGHFRVYSPSRHQHHRRRVTHHRRGHSSPFGFFIRF